MNSNFPSLATNLNPHLQFTNTFNLSLNNLRKSELRQIGQDLKLPSMFLNQNKMALIDKIKSQLFLSPHFQTLFTRYDSPPFDHSPILQKILSEVFKKISLPNTNSPYHMPALEIYPHHQGMTQFRTTTSNFYQEPNNTISNPLPPMQHFVQPNICLSSSLLCKHSRPGSILSCITKGCERRFHTECLRMPEKELERETKSFECPYCVLEKNDPLCEIQTVLLPPFIVKSGEQIQFIMDYSNLKALTEDPDKGVEVRCLKFDYKYMNEQSWLDSGELYLNCRKVQEFKPLQINSALKKRKDEKLFLRDNLISINTIKFIDFKPSFDQKVNVRYDENAIYMAGVYLVKRLRAEELVSKVQKFHVKEADICKARIFSEIDMNIDDCKVSIDKVSISLLDAIDKQMIKTPAKTVFCTHLQCFSLENFIRLMEMTVPRKWRCPICKIKAFDLIVDGYLWDIIKEIATNAFSAVEVTFLKDGTYEFKKEEDDKVENEEEKINNKIEGEENGNEELIVRKTEIWGKSVKQKEIIILDEDDDLDSHAIALPEVTKPIENNNSNIILNNDNDKNIVENNDLIINLQKDNEPNENNEEKNKDNELNNNLNNTIYKDLEINKDDNSKKDSINDNLNNTDLSNNINEEININAQNFNTSAKSIEVLSKIISKPSEITTMLIEENPEESSLQSLALEISIHSNDNEAPNPILEKPQNKQNSIEIENEPEVEPIQPENLQKITIQVQVDENKNITNDDPLIARKNPKKERFSLEAALEQNPMLQVYNLEDPIEFSSKMPLEENSKENKEMSIKEKENGPIKRKREEIEEEFKERIQGLLLHKTIKKQKNYQTFISPEGTVEEETPSMNLISNPKSRSFIVKLYKKQFPDIARDLLLLKPLTNTVSFHINPNNNSNTTPNPMDLQFSNNQLSKTTNNNNNNSNSITVPSNFSNILNNGFDLGSQNMFPMNIFGDKSLMNNNNNSNYMNFSMNPHSLFEGNNAFGKDFPSSQNQILKNINSFRNQPNSHQMANLNQIKPNNDIINNNNNNSNVAAPKIKNRKPVINQNNIDVQKMSQLKNTGFEGNPICLDD